jgi:hypothetical protein
VTEGGDFGRGLSGPRPFDFAEAVSDPAPSDDPRPLHPLQAELITAAGAIVLLVSLLFLKWFGVGGPVGRIAPRAVATGSVGAWQTLGVLRWLALVTIALALAPVLIRLAQRWLGSPRRTSAAAAALGGLTALLLSYRVLVDLPDPSRVVDQKAGAILGVLGALLIAVGARESTRAHSTQAGALHSRTQTGRARVPPGQIARVQA